MEALIFIRDWAIITPSDLMTQFGLSEIGAAEKLSRLKKQKLVINEVRGEWTITDEGLRRLEYYRR